MSDQDDKNPKEFWISPTKTWSDETQSHSIEKISVERVTGNQAQAFIMANTDGIHVIEKSAYDSLQRELGFARSIANQYGQTISTLESKLADLLMDHNELKSKLAEKDTEMDQ